MCIRDRVYLAFTRGGRPVAVKVVRPELADDPDFRSRFRQEVASARRVSGLYTAQVLDADPDATPPWLATAYVPGPSLQQAIADYGPMPADTVLLLMAGVAEALQAIHAAGLVHRDLKPSNVLLAADGPRVIDFGIARAVEATSLTRSGMRVGSPQFMAPEQVAGEAVTPAIDVFALGSLAAYAAAGRPAFGEGTYPAVMYRVMHEPPDLAGCPAPLRALIEQCLAKQPAARPAPGDIVAACRSQTAGGNLEIAQSWLPPAIAAALPEHAPPAVPPARMPPPGPAPAGPGLTGPVPPGPYPPTPPYAPAGPRTVTTHPSSGPPGSWGAYPGPGAPHDGRPGGPRRSLSRGAALAGAGAVVLVAALITAGVLAWHAASGGSHQPSAGSSPRAQGVAGVPDASQQPTAPASTQPPSPAAWYIGTWVGTADQPTGIVTHWTVQLTFSAASNDDTFAFPSLHCSGILVVTSAGPTTVSADENVTSNPRGLCASAGLMTLTKSGATGMDMAWQDVSNQDNVAAGELTRGLAG